MSVQVNLSNLNVLGFRDYAIPVIVETVHCCKKKQERLNNNEQVNTHFSKLTVSATRILARARVSSIHRTCW